MRWSIDGETGGGCRLLVIVLLTATLQLCPGTQGQNVLTSSSYVQPYFYQLGNDLVPDMQTFDMGLVGSYVQCFYHTQRDWMDSFMMNARYQWNTTFYTQSKINQIQDILAQMPPSPVDHVHSLDILMQVAGYDPTTFRFDSSVRNRINDYYSQNSNPMDPRETAFFWSLMDVLGDSYRVKYDAPVYSDADDREMSDLTGMCAPRHQSYYTPSYSYSPSSYIMPSATSWYSSSTLYNSPSYFYQLGNDLVPDMQTFDMGLVGSYVQCFYHTQRDWMDSFMMNARYQWNTTFYTQSKINQIQDILAQMPPSPVDHVHSLDILMQVAGYDPTTFRFDSSVRNRINDYYSQNSNPMDPRETAFFWSLMDVLGDSYRVKYDAPVYSDADDREMSDLTGMCAPRHQSYYTPSYSYSPSSYIMPSATSWYSSSTLYNSPSYFYQLGNDLVPDMQTFDMGLVGSYVQCFYHTQRDWMDSFMMNARYQWNTTFYTQSKINQIQDILAQMPPSPVDHVHSLDILMQVAGYDPTTFRFDSSVRNRINDYYSQNSNPMDPRETAFFWSLMDVLGDSYRVKYDAPVYSDADDREMSDLTGMCAPRHQSYYTPSYSYSPSSYIMPSATSWYSSSTLYNSPSYFYQLGNDLVPDMQTFDMGLVGSYVQCFYHTQRDWMDSFMMNARYQWNTTFYTQSKINQIQDILAQMPPSPVDHVHSLDILMQVAGYDPTTFRFDSSVRNRINDYYSQNSNPMDPRETAFFWSLMDVLGDSYRVKYDAPVYSDADDREMSDLTGMCAPRHQSYYTPSYSYSPSSYIMPSATSWYSSSTLYNSPSYFYQLGNDLVPDMQTFDMGHVGSYVQCFYHTQRDWMDSFMMNARYQWNTTFYTQSKINQIQDILAQMPPSPVDHVHSLDILMQVAGYDPTTFRFDSSVRNRINDYYSQNSNPMDPRETAFFWSLMDVLGDSYRVKYDAPVYSDADDREMSDLTGMCAPRHQSYYTPSYSYSPSSYIMPSATSWYSSSTLYNSPSYFYQLGNDLVPDMQTFDMGLVGSYVQCFYHTQRDWMDSFMMNARYQWNTTFYTQSKINQIQDILAQMPPSPVDHVHSLDILMQVAGYDPTTFRFDSSVRNRINDYYSQNSNPMDPRETAFFWSLMDVLGDSYRVKYDAPVYSDADDREMSDLTGMCAPRHQSYYTPSYSYSPSSYIMPSATSWYSSSTLYNSPSYFYQLGNDLVPDMQTFDMGHVGSYVQCFYHTQRDWMDSFMMNARYQWNTTFYTQSKINQIQDILAQMPPSPVDHVHSLDILMQVAGYDPTTFRFDSSVRNRINDYYSQNSNPMDPRETAFFWSLMDVLGDSYRVKYDAPVYSDADDREMSDLTGMCAPRHQSYYTPSYSYSPSSYIMPSATSWYSSSTLYNSPSYFYQLGNDLVPDMQTFDMGLVGSYVQCFYHTQRDWMDSFMMNARYQWNTTFYTQSKINQIQDILAQMPPSPVDHVHSLDILMQVAGYDPTTFRFDSSVRNRINDYYSQNSNPMDPRETAFFWSLMDVLGDSYRVKYDAPVYSDADDREMSDLTGMCAPRHQSYYTPSYSYSPSSYIMPSATSWYSSSTLYNSPSYFYQLGNDLVPDMQTFDMGLVGSYVQCFYHTQRDWMDSFMMNARYQWNTTFYTQSKINQIQDILAQMPPSPVDHVHSLDILMQVAGYDPTTFRFDSSVRNRINDYYSQNSNPMDPRETAFFWSLMDVLGDSYRVKYDAPVYSDADDREMSDLTGMCAPRHQSYYTPSYSYSPSSYIMPSATSWYSSSTLYNSPSYFYQLGNDLVPDMQTFDMGLVGSYVQCFYHTQRDWMDSFMMNARYQWNTTFYTQSKINQIQDILAQMPPSPVDHVHSLDILMQVAGYDPTTFRFDSSVRNRINDYYSQNSNPMDPRETAFFWSLMDVLGDSYRVKYDAPVYSDADDREMSDLTGMCAPRHQSYYTPSYSYSPSSYIMPSATSWYSSSTLYNSPSYFYQLGNDLVPDMQTFDMGLVGSYVQCFYHTQRDWMDSFMMNARYQWNTTFYTQSKINQIQDILAQMPPSPVDHVHSLDILMQVAGYDPTTFRFDSSVRNRINDYYSQNSNPMDPRETAFFWSLMDVLGDSYRVKYDAPVYSDADDREMSDLTGMCAPRHQSYYTPSYSYSPSSYIMPSATSWYSSSTLYNSPSYFYQLGNDLVPDMQTFDMGLVGSYVQCFYHTQRDWMDSFMMNARYQWNTTFYTQSKINQIQDILAQMPPSPVDHVHSLDILMQVAGYDPTTFRFDSSVRNRINHYYSQNSNPMDPRETAFFWSLMDVLGDSYRVKYDAPVYSDADDREMSDLTGMCAPRHQSYYTPSYSYSPSSYIMPSATSWYSSSTLYNSPSYFYQLGNDLVPDMQTFDMGLVGSYVQCFYHTQRDWMDSFMMNTRYQWNTTFYTQSKINQIQDILAQMPPSPVDHVHSLDILMQVAGYDPTTFRFDSSVRNRINDYYSQNSNPMDPRETAFFWSLMDVLGDSYRVKYDAPVYSDADDREMSDLTGMCAPRHQSYYTPSYSYSPSSYIMPSATSWYSSSTLYNSPSYFYQLGNDLVPDMQTFDMGLVRSYVQCFYHTQRDWMDSFMMNARYQWNTTFYTQSKINQIQDILAQMPPSPVDHVHSLDILMQVAGYDPTTFRFDSSVRNRINDYYSQNSNPMDPRETAFFWSLMDVLEDSYRVKYDAPVYSDADDREMSDLTGMCAPRHQSYYIPSYSYSPSSYIMPSATSWYSSSTLYNSPSYFYQLGNDLVPDMQTFDMGLVGSYVQCFYHTQRDWMDSFMMNARYQWNTTFYTQSKINQIQDILAQMPPSPVDHVHSLDILMQVAGYDPITFRFDSSVRNRINDYYSQNSNPMDPRETAFFWSLMDVLGDSYRVKYDAPVYSDADDREMSDLTGMCAPRNQAFFSSMHVSSSAYTVYPSFSYQTSYSSFYHPSSSHNWISSSSYYTAFSSFSQPFYSSNLYSLPSYFTSSSSYIQPSSSYNWNPSSSYYTSYSPYSQLSSSYNPNPSSSYYTSSSKYNQYSSSYNWNPAQSYYTSSALYNQPSSSYNWNLSSSYNTRSTSYNQPSSSYNWNPSSSYYTGSSSYNQPSASFNWNPSSSVYTSSSSYNQPSSSFNWNPSSSVYMSSSSYNQPSFSFNWNPSSSVYTSSSSYNQPSSSYNWNPSSSVYTSSSSYSQPSSSYNWNPSSSYYTSSLSYNQPSSSYNLNPSSGYNTRSMSYNQLSSSYSWNPQTSYYTSSFSYNQPSSSYNWNPSQSSSTRSTSYNQLSSSYNWNPPSSYSTRSTSYNQLSSSYKWNLKSSYYTSSSSYNQPSSSYNWNLSSSVYTSLSSYSQLSSSYNWNPSSSVYTSSSSHSQPSSNFNWNPSSSYYTSSSSYNQPSSGYNWNPSSSVYTGSSSYNQPSSSYNLNPSSSVYTGSSSYNQPSSSYNWNPSSSYNTRSTSYNQPSSSYNWNLSSSVYTSSSLYNQPSSSYNWNPSSSYTTRSTSYNQLSSSYSWNPQSSYYTSSSSYNQPSSSFNWNPSSSVYTSSSSYNQPSSSYNWNPSSRYNTRSTSYNQLSSSYSWNPQSSYYTSSSSYNQPSSSYNWNPSTGYYTSSSSYNQPSSSYNWNPSSSVYTSSSSYSQPSSSYNWNPSSTVYTSSSSYNQPSSSYNWNPSSSVYTSSSSYSQPSSSYNWNPSSSVYTSSSSYNQPSSSFNWNPSSSVYTSSSSYNQPSSSYNWNPSSSYNTRSTSYNQLSSSYSWNPQSSYYTSSSSYNQPSSSFNWNPSSSVYTSSSSYNQPSSSFNWNPSSSVYTSSSSYSQPSSSYNWNPSSSYYTSSSSYNQSSSSLTLSPSSSYHTSSSSTTGSTLTLSATQMLSTSTTVTSPTGASASTASISPSSSAVVSSTTVCLPGSGFCFMNAPDLGGSAGMVKPSTLLISLFVMLCAVLWAK